MSVWNELDSLCPFLDGFSPYNPGPLEGIPVTVPLNSKRNSNQGLPRRSSAVDLNKEKGYSSVCFQVLEYSLPCPFKAAIVTLCNLPCLLAATSFGIPCSSP